MNTEPEREFLGNGRYAVDQLLGKGGSGEVVLAYDISLNRWVAIKRIPATDAEILMEAKVLASFQHPNIVMVYDVFQEGGEILLIMEFVQGQTLEQLVEAMNEETFRNFAAQCLEGLGAAHAKKIVHRDIKPGNIMLAQLPEGGCQVKLLDFGQSRLMEAPSLQTMDHSGAVVGSVFMMSPEQLNHEELDLRTDFYSLGCVFYQALTLQRPFNGAHSAQILSAHLNHTFQPLASIRPDLPKPLTDWVERMFSLDRNDRPASASKALKALESTMSPPSLAQAISTATMGVNIAAPVLKAVHPVDLSAATQRVLLPPKAKSQSAIALAPVAEGVPVVVPAVVAKPTAVAVAALPVSAASPARQASSVMPVKPYSPSPLRSSEPESPKKPPLPLWIAVAAAAVVLIFGGVFFTLQALAPKGELLYGADLSNGIFPPGTWAISGGIMKGNGKSEVLWTKKEYENFELHFEVRVAPNSDSGIYLRCPNLEELMKKRVHYRQSALEVEIIHGSGDPGAILTVCKPTKPVALVPGKWHTYDIKAKGNLITVALDGRKLYDLDLSKGNKPGKNPDGTTNNYPVALVDLPNKGRIGIQDRLGPVEFRNFRVKEL